MKSTASRFILAIITVMMAFVFGNTSVAQTWICLDKIDIMYPDEGDINRGLFPNKSEAHIQKYGKFDGSIEFKAYQTPSSWAISQYRIVETQAWFTMSDGTKQMVLNNTQVTREGGGGSYGVFQCQQDRPPLSPAAKKFTMIITIYDVDKHFVCSNMVNYYSSVCNPGYPWW
jgi:hypothetical protein